MTRIQLAAACLVVALGAAQAHAQLAIRDIEAAHGRSGTKRESQEYYAGDQVYIRFVVHGAQVDKAGEADVIMTMVVTDAAGNKLVDNDSRLNDALALGGGTFPGEAQVDLGPGTAPGKYTVSLRIKDRISKETASFERQFTCKPAEFAITAVRFYHDAEGRIPAPLGGVLGEVVHFRHQAIGFDRSTGALDLAMNLRVLDEQGTEVARKPIEARVRSEDEAAVKNATHVNFSGHLALNRVGNFTVRIDVTDRIANKTTSFEAPLRVAAP